MIVRDRRHSVQFGVTCIHSEQFGNFGRIQRNFGVNRRNNSEGLRTDSDAFAPRSGRIRPRVRQVLKIVPKSPNWGNFFQMDTNMIEVSRSVQINSECFRFIMMQCRSIKSPRTFPKFENFYITPKQIETLPKLASKILRSCRFPRMSREVLQIQPI